MEKYVVMGGRPLSGKVTIGGSKNSVLTLLPACLLTDEKCVLYDAPDLSDVNHMLSVLEVLGADTDKKQRTITVDAARLQFQTIPDRLARSLSLIHI